MDTILGIDNNETKKVDISNAVGGITGSIDFLSDNNSDKSNMFTIKFIAKCSPRSWCNRFYGYQYVRFKPPEETNLFGSGDSNQPKPPTKKLNLRKITL